MGFGARALTASGLALLLALLLWLAGRQSAPPPESSHQAAREESGEVPPASRAQFAQSLECRSCHAAVYDEWRQDEHATAWTEDLFRVFTADYRQVECLPCHAPAPMLETGIEKTPQLRNEARPDGVGCPACHVRDHRACGPRGSTAPCGGAAEPALKTSRACFHCHSAHDLFKEYESSEQARQGMICQDCHMPKRRLQDAEGGPARDGRSHRFIWGGHDPEGLRRALKLDLAVQASELTVTITNVGAAHGVPGEINNRVVCLEVSVLAPGGGAEAPEEEVLARRETLRAPKRLARGLVPTTQVLPGQPRVYAYRLPVSHGRVSASLTYKLQDSLLDSQAVPMTGAELRF
jgi:nitrate/TMAO reductase-like tetraheme cytochrome c subunit